MAGAAASPSSGTAPVARIWPLVQMAPAAKLRRTFGAGTAMNSGVVLRSLVAAVLLAGAAWIAPALAEGTFDLPAGARFNPQKLERIGEFFRKEVADGKIPGAILLISQHGKPVYFEKFGLRD